MARSGARIVREGSASAAWRDAVERATGEPSEPFEPEVFSRVEGDERDRRTTRRADDRSGAAPRRVRRPRRPHALPDDIAAEISAVGGRRASRLRAEATEAVDAYDAGRYQEAERRLRAVVKVAPSVAGLREIYGLTLYRLGRWKAALAELDLFHAMTGELTQYPVAADCYRALGRHKKVDELWNELRRSSPGVEVLSEGRLVAAGSLADRGQLRPAIDLLAGYEADRARPKEWHMRTWYALADLYERAGDVPRARELFRRLAKHDSAFFDVAERLSALG